MNLSDLVFSLQLEGSKNILQKDKLSYFFRKNHPANSLFLNSRYLSPATTNLIAMRQTKIDRSAYSPENADPFVKQSEICCSQGDPLEISHRCVSE